MLLKSMPKNIASQSGFTLIEVILYVGLLGLVMGAVLVGTYNLIESTDKTQTKSYVQSEAGFILAKIDYAMNGATAISGSGSNLAVTNIAFPGNTATFGLSGNRIQLNGVDLNGTIAPITNLTFTVGGTAPNQTLTTQFTVTNPIYSDTFTSTKVIR